MNFENLLSLTWKTVNRDTVDVVSALEPYLESETLNIHVGTDGQKAGGALTDFVTCVCVYDLGKGGRVFYHKFKNINAPDLWSKLSTETILSLQVAVELSEHLPNIKERIVVHVDANPNIKHKSSDHVKTLAGMCMGYGFNYVLKPNAWASSHCADHVVKNKHLPRRPMR